MSLSVRRLATASILALVFVASVSAQPAASLEQRFRVADRDNNGKLTPAEFPRAQLLRLLDHNKDGVLTIDEVSRRNADGGADSIKATKNVAYGTNRAQRLDLYAPKEKPSKAPVMVFVHGGAWKIGNKSGVGQKPTFFTQRGWLLASVGYRLLPAGRHPSNAEDVAAAVAWIHGHIAAHGGDPDSIFLMGHSAGCHLVSLVATDARHLKKAGKPLSVVKGVVALDTQAYDVPKLIKQTRSNIYAGVFSTDEVAQRDASPIHHVKRSRDIPPFLICYSRGLQLRANPMRATSAREFAAALKAAGVRVEIVDASERSHSEINRRLGDPTDEKVTGRVVEFLDHVRKHK